MRLFSYLLTQRRSVAEVDPDVPVPGMFAVSRAATFAGTVAVVVSGSLAAVSQQAHCDIDVGLISLDAASRPATFAGVGAVAVQAIMSSASAAATFSGTATGGTSPSAQLRVQVKNAQITLGGTLRLTGTSPVVSLSVTPSSGGSLTYATGSVTPNILVKYTTGGILGVGVFEVSYNGGSTFAHTLVTIPAGGTYDLDGAAANLRLTFASGTYVLNDTHEGAVATIKSSEGHAYTFTNATAAQQPIYRDPAVTADGKSALFFAGAQVLHSTDAAAAALFADDPAYTLMYRLAFTVADAAGYVVSSCDSADNTNKRKLYGQITTGLGRDVYIWRNNAAGTATHTCTTDPMTGGANAKNVCWHAPGSNGGQNIRVNDSSEGLGVSAANIGTTTPNRVSLGADGKSTVATFFSGTLYDLVYFNTQLSSGDKTTWNSALASGAT